jgi:hypothetical protein
MRERVGMKRGREEEREGGIEEREMEHRHEKVSLRETKIYKDNATSKDCSFFCCLYMFGTNSICYQCPKAGYET